MPKQSRIVDYSDTSDSEAEAETEKQLDAHYEVSESYTQHVKRFGYTGQAFDVHFKRMESFEGNSDELAERVFGKVIAKSFVEADSPNDRVGVQVDADCLDSPIIIPFSNREQLTSARILGVIRKVQQSKRSLTFDDAMRVRVVRVKPMQPASGRTGTKQVGDHDTWEAKKNCFIAIPEDSELCVARSVVTGRAHARWQADRTDQLQKAYKKLARSDAGAGPQIRAASELMAVAGLQNHTGGCGMAEVALLQAAVAPECQLKVISRDHGKAVIFSGPEARLTVYLYFNRGHCQPITTMTGFAGLTYYCGKCDKARQSPEHECRGSCPVCHGRGHCPAAPHRYCAACNRKFRGPGCLAKHLETDVVLTNGKRQQKVSCCDRYKRCKDCGMTHAVKTGKNAHR
jgi:hypothetical protein